MTRSSSLLALLACLACVMVPYVAPQDGPRARVRFAVNGGGDAVLRNYRTPTCQGEETWVKIQEAWIFAPRPKRLGMPLSSDDHRAQEVYLPAGQVLHFMYVGEYYIANTLSKCGVSFSVRLDDGKDYELVYSIEPAFLDRKPSCRVTFNELVSVALGGHERVRSGMVSEIDEGRAEECQAAFHRFRLFSP